MPTPEDVNLAAKAAKETLGFQKGAFALVLGTGLGFDSESLGSAESLDCADLPGYPPRLADRLNPVLTSGEIRGRRVLMLRGRAHLYDGFSPAEVVFGVRLLHALGADKLMLTNAAGALNPLFETGQIMLIRDQINFTGVSPLTGINHEPWGPKFPDLSRMYSQRLAEIALYAAGKLGLRLERGVYLGVHGPELETPAETRAYRLLGADAIGMSTVLEAIAARHLGMELIGLSCLTNKNLPDCMAETSLEEVVAVAGSVTPILSALAREIIASA